MLQRDDGETEILLGNKQLLGIRREFGLALGAAFVGGYMVGKGNAPKKAVAPVASATPDTSTADNSNTTAQVGETHSVMPDESAALSPEPAREEPLGSPKKKKAEAAQASVNTRVGEDSFTPESGQEFLQVAAVPRDHALAVAAVLRKKGFRAHAVAKPGSASIYRVIVGPIRSAGELSSTRDSLRKTGFNQVLVQRYQ
jgi:cell division septation protein DedD